MVEPSIEALPSSSTPATITGRGPKRSATIPQSGAPSPWTIAETDSAPAVSPRDQRNSAMRGTKKIENEKNKP